MNNVLDRHTIKCRCGLISRRLLLFSDVTQLHWLVGYRRFGEAYQSIFKSQAVQEEYFLDYLTLVNGMIESPETSVPKYQPTLCNIQKEGRLKLHHSGSLKFRLIWYTVVTDGLRKTTNVWAKLAGDTPEIRKKHLPNITTPTRSVTWK